MEDQILELPAATGSLAYRAKRRPLWKRAMDLITTVAVLPVLIPLMLSIALLIKLVSRGPVLFRQDRIGYYGRPFVCLKFRTMRVDASTAVHQGYFKQLMNSDEPMTKMDTMGDPRLIPFGSVLRATGLDELPQLLNVWRGEMSIVGPRPCTPFEYSNYRPWQKQRFHAFPGLTGLWQVSGKNKTTFNEMIRFDILYAEKKSLWLDLKIILKTFPVVLFQLKDIMVRKLKGRPRNPTVP